jgi:hypothetical protein
MYPFCNVGSYDSQSSGQKKITQVHEPRSPIRTTSRPYTGPTAVSAGRLTLNNGLDTPGGGINVASGATLQTRGFVTRSISGAGTITAMGSLIIGNSSSPSGVALDGTLNVGAHQVVLNDADTAQLGSSTTLGTGGRLNLPQWTGPRRYAHNHRERWCEREH